MKSFFKTGIILVAIFMITGCVKVEFSMGINKDKSMDLQIVEAVEKSLLEGSSMMSDEDIKKAEDQGFLVRDYDDGNMKGYTFTKQVKNIDDLSTEENGIVSDLSLLFEESDLSLFSIKKGFFKNTYTAKLKMSDMDDFDSMMGDDSSMDNSEDDESDLEDDFMGDMDYSQMMSNMEMNFVVNLPYKALNSNATSIKNDGKELTWNLLTFQAETIDFEFELYNMTNIYIVIGGVLLVVILLIVTIVKKVSKGGSSNNGQMMSNNVNGYDFYMNNQDSTDYNSNFNSSSSMFNTESSNSFISQSNSMFFQSQNVAMNTMEQTNLVNSSSLDSVNYNNNSTGNDFNQTIMPTQNIESQIVTLEQNSQEGSNKFFQDPNNM